MPGRKSAIPLQDQKRIIHKYASIFEKSYPSITHDVYERIQNELYEIFQYKMSKMAIQMSVRRNKYFFFHDRVTDVMADDITDKAINEKDFDSNCEFENIDDSISNSDLIVKFLMDIHEFKRIAPKNHTLLQNSWTNELQDNIWKKTDLICTFAFKNNYVPSNFLFDTIKCNGKCTQCDAVIHVDISPKTENFFEVICQININKKDYVHDSNVKNKLTSTRKRKIAEQLKYEKALKVRTLLADELMTIDSPKEPPTLPKLNNLRKIRHHVKRALQFDKNTIISIYAMSQSSPFDTFIRKFSLVPFFIYLWTNEQSKYYDEVLKNTHTVLSIDATGSIFQPIAPPGVNLKDAKHTFLYAVMAYTTSTSIPLCYMVSQSHTIEAIATWLSTWAVNRSLPKEIVCDDSSALLGAICRTFLHTDTNGYLSQCFSLLEGLDVCVPVCYIRLDKSHFFKKLPKQSSFDKASEKCKYFYISCIKKIHKLHCYKEIRSVINDIVTVSLHKYVSPGLDGQLCGKYEQALQRLTDYKDDTNVIGVDDDDQTDKHFLDEDDEVTTNTGIVCPLINYYNKIIETEQLYLLLLDPKHEQKNEYYLPSINDTLKRLLRKLPMWGNVMTKYFSNAKDVASSSNNENHFKDLKTIYFNTKDERIRLDEFIVQHYSFINGCVKLNISENLVKTKLNKDIKQKRNMNNDSDVAHETKSKIVVLQNAHIPQTSTHNLENLNVQNLLVDRKTPVHTQNMKYNEDFELESIFQDEPVEVENWRGLAVSRKRKNVNIKSIYILQNGNIAISRNKRIILTNTCAFDAVSQALAVAYKDRITFRQEINNNKRMQNDAFTTFIANVATAKNFSQKIYNQRDVLLSNVFCADFKTANETTVNVINCACNITKIFEEICISYFSATRKRICSNTNCTSHKNKETFKCKYLPLNIDLIKQKGIPNLQESVEAGMKNDFSPLCVSCKIGTISFQYHLNHLIIFELHDINIQLNDIPINIEINNRLYVILAVIEFQPPLSLEGIGHYKAHCYRAQTRTFQCYDDMYGKIQKSQINVMPHAIIYTLQSDISHNI